MTIEWAQRERIGAARTKKFDEIAEEYKRDLQVMERANPFAARYIKFMRKRAKMVNAGRDKPKPSPKPEE